MVLFGAKKTENKQEQKSGIIGFTKPKRFLFLKMKSKPIYGAQGSQNATQILQQTTSAVQTPEKVVRQRIPPPFTLQRSQKTAPEQQMYEVKKKAKRPNALQMYLASVASKHKNLEASLRAQNIKESPYEFVKKMFIYSLLISSAAAIAIGILLMSYGVTPILALLLGVGCFYGFFNKFIRYPIDRSTVVGKDIEKDILFAARDLVISMRSGMPLFNAVTAVSTGYGAASLEFAKVVELVQLGAPIEEALDDVSSKSQSRTFKRIMLQATVSLRAGADVVGALQGVVDEVMQERVIELRRYGQRLNALAMFYMLFGVIFPSMGIAVAAILTTFINLFTVDENTLIFALVGIFFLQIIFLNVMRSSRPTFAM
ncbi:MAG: type II secretion system F family protein [Candidatus Micrarchaeales archaeon]|jgi:flagellar protein FlaJ